MAPHIPEVILIVDDEPGIVRGLARLLRHDGYLVDTASNGRHALARLQSHRYDVILSDLRMPELDGQGFYAYLRQHYAYLRQRVIFLTGDYGEADSAAFLAQCGERWLRKPCTIATVRRAIQQVLSAAGRAPQPGQERQDRHTRSQHLWRKSHGLRRKSYVLSGKVHALCTQSTYLRVQAAFLRGRYRSLTGNPLPNRAFPPAAKSGEKSSPR
jgi:CheY-like chemotaxis protein